MSKENLYWVLATEYLINRHFKLKQISHNICNPNAFQ